MSQCARNGRNFPAALIAFCYTVVGLAWIFFSDRLAAALFPQSLDDFLRISTLKGSCFVLGTALLLYGLLCWYGRMCRHKDQALRESEERYRLVVQSAPEAILVFDGERVVFVNAAARRLFGAASAQALEGTARADLMAPDSRRVLLQRLGAVAAKAEAIDLGWQRWQRLDGHPLDLEGTAVPFGGEPQTAVLIFLRDVGPQRAAERSLRKSEDQYRLLAENSHDLIFTLDADYHHTYISPSVRKLRGVSVEEAMRESLADVMTPESYAQVRERIAHPRVPNQDASHMERMELELRCRDGSTVWVESVVRSMFDEAGTFRGFVGVARDITERRRAEEERNRSQMFLTKILAAIPDPVFVKDAERRFVLVNEALCVFFGYPRQEMIGRKDTDFPASGMANASAAQLLASGGEDIVEERLTDRLGRVRISMTKRGLFIDDQGERFIVGVIRDVTEGRDKEVLLRKSLQEKEVLLKEVHHRVKNNLQIISSLLFLQKEGLADPAIQDLLEESRHRIASMALVHEELYRSGDLGRVDLREYLERLASKVVQSLRGDQDLALRLELTTCLLPLDKAIPFGLLVNELLTNAVKHGFAGREAGSIRLRVQVEDDLLRAEVADDGVGLPEGFHPEAATSLGMQLVVQLTRQLRGVLTFGMGRETVFRLSFPLTDPPA